MGDNKCKINGIFPNAYTIKCIFTLLTVNLYFNVTVVIHVTWLKGYHLGKKQHQEKS